MSEFPCNQTPLHLSDNFNLNSIKIQLSADYGNATARLWSINKGRGVISIPPSGNGILIDENIQTTFTYNGISYTLIEVRILNGHHKLFPWVDVSGQCIGMTKRGTYTTAPLEVYCFFKNNNDTIALVLPIGLDPTRMTNASKYISALDMFSVPDFPLLSTLFQDLSGAKSSPFNANNQVLQYTGQDIRINCDSSSVPNPVRYLVIMNDKKFSSTITPTDYTTLRNKLNSNLNLDNSIVSIESSSETINKLLFIGKGILYITTKGGINTLNTNTVNTNSLKCYPVDRIKNIRDGKVYLDKNGSPININCPSTDFKFFQTNKGNYCCNGSIINNKCIATDKNTFCGLDPSPVDPDTGLPISTCDDTKNNLKNISNPPLSTSFFLSAAGIETIVAIVISILIGGIGIFLLAKRSFTATATATAAATAAAFPRIAGEGSSSKSNGPAAELTAATAAIAATAAAFPRIAGEGSSSKSSGPAAGLTAATSSLWNPPGGSWWNVVPIALIILFVLSSTAAIVFASLYFTK